MSEMMGIRLGGEQRKIYSVMYTGLCRNRKKEGEKHKNTVQEL